MLIAPATANTISKIAQGIADNLLTSVACAFSKKMIIAPAMNCNMWNNTAVQENLSKLKTQGVEILEPESGFLACGYIGKGRLCSIDKIFDAVSEALNYSQKLKGIKVVITTNNFEAPYKIVKVKSALDMQNAIDNEFATSDIIIMAAAVADYRVKNYSEQKMKKGIEDNLTLELVKNPDI